MASPTGRLTRSEPNLQNLPGTLAYDLEMNRPFEALIKMATPIRNGIVIFMKQYGYYLTADVYLVAEKVYVFKCNKHVSRSPLTWRTKAGYNAEVEIGHDDIDWQDDGWRYIVVLVDHVKVFDWYA